MAGGFDVVEHLSVLLLVASACLLGPSLVGVGGSLLLASALAVLGGLLVLARETEVGSDAGTNRDGLDLVTAGAVGPLAAAAVVVSTAPTTAGELQTLGGLLGLVAMVNYFLLPIYRMLWSLVR